MSRGLEILVLKAIEIAERNRREKKGEIKNEILAVSSNSK